MTVTDSFPLGYFYIISKFNGLALDIDKTEPIEAGSKVVTAVKIEDRQLRDSQLWIHQNGFLTNKLGGLVLDIGRSKSFMAIFSGEEHVYVDNMKHENDARDQRFGYSSEHGHIYTLFETNDVVDIRKKKEEPGAAIMIYHKAENVEEGINQLWDLQLADPPRVLDSSDDEEDDDKCARLRSWFGNWGGWGKDDKEAVLKEKELKAAHEKVYEKNKSHLSYEVIAGAVAVQAVKMYMDQKEEAGEDIHFKGAKQAIAGYAATEMVKMFMERGTDDDDEDDDEEQKEKKKSVLQNMAVSAAQNYFDMKK
ncbi:uncharacterized protein EV154DRAFT_521870 [Mucor mucedo]|uniref:uncharacterized protein n=1 Tax=Mucor mucedo TaxID=29922 RepID=UPI00221F5E6F|nr:uncharacterized protein EV154DRAFT_521870 [Mucor mucedo]KAI7884977.1 hypothetical protein EV154DRAFT_521870 [Mucor mucedo]